MDYIEVRTDPAKTTPFDRFFLIFQAGFSEIKRKGTVTRLHFEIKNFEREKQKFVQALGVRAWEAHIHHPDFAGILVHLKELQIEMNRFKTQFGEHETQITDIENTKTELTEQFNRDLDELELRIVPHRAKIETINAEKESNKIQIEELRSKQDQLSHQVRLHQQSIQELDLGDDLEKESKIQIERDAIRSSYQEKSEIDCKIPLMLSQAERLKIDLAKEYSEIDRLEHQRESTKRDFEQRIKDSNHQIEELEKKKKVISHQIEQSRKEMQPYYYELGAKVERLRMEEAAFRENYDQLDSYTHEIETRNRQIVEAHSLSRAMDQGAWTKFLVLNGATLVLIVCAAYLLL